MNDRTRPPLTLHLPDRSPDDLDRLLHNFFRAELPEPWPAWSPPAAEPQSPFPPGRPRWVTLRRRLAVAASVGLVLVGYLLLARAFPGSEKATGLEFGPGHLGKRDLPFSKFQRPRPPGEMKAMPPKTVPIPRGGQARMWEQHLPGGRFQFQLQLQNPDNAATHK